MTLLPGDVVITGTPAGVGGGMKPPRYLKKETSSRLKVMYLVNKNRSLFNVKTNKDFLMD
jgi:2-keto-4-pentenoate hydratase/2-oxohepta-3-ene-1,7-dioic acid hydratase in catechol pathway